MKVYVSTSPGQGFTSVDKLSRRWGVRRSRPDPRGFVLSSSEGLVLFSGKKFVHGVGSRLL